MILVTGTPGNIGTPLAQHLLGQGRKIRLMVRNPKKQDQVVADLQSRGAEIVQGDYADPRSLADCFTGVESAFLLVPVALETADWKGNFVKAAEQNGVERIVNLSVSGASSTTPIDLFRWHWQAEQTLESSGIAWTHLQPTDLARFNIRSILPTVEGQGAFYSSIGQGRVALVDEEDVAEVAAAALTEEGHERKKYVLTGPKAVSYPEIADALANKLGKPVTYIDIEPAKAKEAMVAAGLPEWVADFINSLRELEKSGGASGPTTDIQNLLGRPPRTLQDSIDAVLG
ncbi:MAG: SDR family NAD(P)-dependent oxidoreductase [Verrucomicrobia bacterium]|nr:SDR family NAD(P)-dependent oxidoreductase [Verrucomicrobiota bacterium]